MKKNKVMRIRDLALLKSNPEEYYLTKTHDGTSMGKIGSTLDDWASKKVEEWNHTVAFFDEEGNVVNKPRPGEGSLSDTTLTNLHIIENSGRYGTNTATRIYENGDPSAWCTDIPHEFLTQSLMTKNANDEYLNRSVSLVSGNGTRMTVIRNDKFNEKDHEPFNETVKDLKVASDKYRDEYDERWKARVQEMIDHNELPKTVQGHPLADPSYMASYLEHKAKQETLNEMGTWEQNVLKGQGFDKRFEECNTKFRVSRKHTDNRDRFSRWNDSQWMIHDSHEENFLNGKPAEERTYDWSGAGYIKEVQPYGKGNRIMWYPPE